MTEENSLASHNDDTTQSTSTIGKDTKDAPVGTQEQISSSIATRAASAALAHPNTNDCSPPSLPAIAPAPAPFPPASSPDRTSNPGSIETIAPNSTSTPSQPKNRSSSPPMAMACCAPSSHRLTAPPGPIAAVVTSSRGASRPTSVPTHSLMSSSSVMTMSSMEADPNPLSAAAPVPAPTSTATTAATGTTTSTGPAAPSSVATVPLPVQPQAPVQLRAHPGPTLATASTVARDKTNKKRSRSPEATTVGASSADPVEHKKKRSSSSCTNTVTYNTSDTTTIDTSNNTAIMGNTNQKAANPVLTTNCHHSAIITSASDPICASTTATPPPTTTSALETSSSSSLWSTANFQKDSYEGHSSYERPTVQLSDMTPTAHPPAQQSQQKDEYIQLSMEQIHSLIDNVNIPSYEIKKTAPSTIRTEETVKNTSDYSSNNKSSSSTAFDTDSNNTKNRADSSLSMDETKSLDMVTATATSAPISQMSNCTMTDKATLSVKDETAQELPRNPVVALAPQVQTRAQVPIKLSPNPVHSSPMATHLASTNTLLSSTNPNSSILSTTPQSPPRKSNKDIEKQKNKSPSQQQQQTPKTSSSGRWSREEHKAFLEGLEIYGREWKKVAHKIPTRTSAQIRSHAQKYFAKLARDEQQQANLWLHSSGSGGSSSHDNIAALGGGLSNSLSSISPDRTGLEHNKLLPPSVLERVDKILKDPKGAQLEVEETLKRLRNRYNELQRKVKEKEATKAAQMNTGTTEHNSLANKARYRYENDRNSILQMKATALTLSQPPAELGDGQFRSVQTHDKKLTPMIALAPPVAQKQSHQQTLIEQSTENNDTTFVATRSQQNNPTSTVTRHRLRNDLLASKELIALHVLGGELFRSASKENLSSSNSLDAAATAEASDDENNKQNDKKSGEEKDETKSKETRR